VAHLDAHVDADLAVTLVEDRPGTLARGRGDRGASPAGGGRRPLIVDAQALPNPQADGFWHPAQGPPAGMAGALGLLAPTANADSCFSTRALRHAGHSGVTPSRISISKRFPQSAQAYSKSGMIAVYRRAPGLVRALT